MGRSDPTLWPFYEEHIKPQGETALLGFVDNRWFDGDLYDLQLNNWNINDNWKLNKKYDTIISLRCPYFAKDPEDFIKRCYNSLNEGGKLYADWGLGDHWRCANYKIGWLKNGEHEEAYEKGNYLWSGIWDDSFLENEKYKLFESRVEKYEYSDVKKAVYEEIPKVLELNTIKKYFDISYSIIALWTGFCDTPNRSFVDDRVPSRPAPPAPQLYILVSGIKR